MPELINNGGNEDCMAKETLPAANFIKGDGDSACAMVALNLMCHWNGIRRVRGTSSAAPCATLAGGTNKEGSIINVFIGANSCTQGSE
jgi:hypothetical protein